jgi:hypothetical protein
MAPPTKTYPYTKDAKLALANVRNLGDDGDISEADYAAGKKSSCAKIRKAT